MVRGWAGFLHLTDETRDRKQEKETRDAEHVSSSQHLFCLFFCLTSLSFGGYIFVVSFSRRCASGPLGGQKCSSSTS